MTRPAALSVARIGPEHEPHLALEDGWAVPLDRVRTRGMEVLPMGVFAPHDFVPA